MQRKLLLLASVLFVLLSSSQVFAETVFTVGVVPQFGKDKIIAIWQPLLTELEKQTGAKFILEHSESIPAFEKRFLQGDFDFVYLNPYHMVIANKDQSYIPLVRDTARALSGLLVVKKEDPIKDVKELNGKELAFPAPNALGASLLMRAELATLYNIDIKPVYVKTHPAVYKSVYDGQTAAGGGVARTYKMQPDEVRDGLRIIYKTRKVAPHPFAAHPRVPQDLQSRVKTALLAMGDSNDGKNLLADIPMKKIGEAHLDEYTILSEWGLDKFFVN